LLVSVKSAIEAQTALAGGAAIIDVKEPAQGPMGRAPSAVWQSVRRVVPDSITVSVALGELSDWLGLDPPEFPNSAWAGISLGKLGLARAPSDWREQWAQIRRSLSKLSGPGIAWIAVVYTDWKKATAPDPDSVISEAANVDECRGVLFDTWDKSHSSHLDLAWKPRIERIRDSGRLVALAGGIDAKAIERLAPLEPDIFAVRAAACAGRDRSAAIDADLVARLAAAVAMAGDHGRSGGPGIGLSSSPFSWAGK
jgi:uncharacterized protein (UPF0264 family)